MKRKITYITALLFVIACAVFLNGCKDKKNETIEANNSVEKQDVEMLLSFDSYEEITGTSLRVGNQFGESGINKDKKYITEGEASWMVKPQGDYGEKNKYPYFRMRCVDTTVSETTFKNSDFFKYDKVMLDVYNASDEAVKIQWNFTVADAFEEYSATDAIVYELKPNAWTTCEYDLSAEDYGSFYDLTSVKFMQVTFLTKKETKDDTVSELYFDNLRAHVAEERRSTSEMEYDFSEGINFEKVTDRYLFRGNSEANYKMELSRAAYEDLDVTPLNDDFGAYALTGNAGGRWPEVTVRLDKAYEKDMMLSFMMYVQVDEAKVGDNKLRLESFNNNVDRVRNDVSYMTPAQFNQWVEVKIILGSEQDSIWFYANFDAGAQSSIFSDDTDIKFYFDNFIITEKIEDRVIHADGSVDILNPYNSTSVKHTFEKRVKDSQSVVFSIDVEPAREMSVWLLGDGLWEDEYYAKWYETWTGKQTIVVDVPEDTENFTIHVVYRDLKAEAAGTEASFKDRVVTISNVKIIEDSEVDMINGITVKSDGSVVITNPFNQDMVRYTFKKTVKKGEVVIFDIDVDPDREMAVWFYGDGVESGATEYYAKWYPTWTGKQTITVEAPKDMTKFSIRVQHRDLKAEESGAKADFSDRVVTVSNVRILTAEEYDALDGIDVLPDGTVVISNPLNLDKVKYTFDKKAKAGEVVVFDIDVDPDKEMAVWLYGDAVESVATEYYAKWYPTWTGKQTIAVEVPKDMSKFMIKAQYRDLHAEEAGTDADFTKRVLTISNVRVLTEEEYEALDGITVLPDGTVQMSNPLNQDKLKYTFEKTVKEGNLIKFDIDVEPKREMAVWLYGDGVESTATEYYAKWYPIWSGTQSITVEAPNDMSKFMIKVQYRDLEAEAAGTDADFTNRVLTISNVTVEEKSQIPEVIENPDGSITLNNPNNKIYLRYTFNQAVAAGEIISFDIDVTPAREMAVWIYRDGEEISINEEYAKWYPTWTGKTTITQVASADMDCFSVRIQPRDLAAENAGTATDVSDRVVTISNVKVSSQQTVDEATGNVTVHTKWLEGATTSTYHEVDYYWPVSLQTGDTITFTLNENGATGTGAFFVYFPVNGTYTQKGAAMWTQNKTFTYTVTEVTDTIKIKSRYFNGESAMKDFIIKDIKIEDAPEDIADITVTASALTGWVNGNHYRVEYIWNQPLKEGDSITFTFDEGNTIANNGAVFVYEGVNGSYTQVTAKTWVQNRTQTFTATQDIDNIRLYVDYYDSGETAVADFIIKDIEISKAE